MGHGNDSNGMRTFAEHWGFVLAAVVAILVTQVLDFFTTLNGGPWILCYSLGLGVAAVGVALIFYAKVPLYRQRRFLTFGSGALPENRRPFYRWGYRFVLLAVALLLCLFLSRP